MVADGPPRGPIFVVGSPRSGTTLLAVVLGRNSAIASLPETNFYNRLIHRDRLHRLWPTPARLDDLFSRTRLRDLALSVEDMPADLLRARHPAPETLFRAILEVCRAKSGKPLVLEKTPLHLRHVDRLVAAFPGCEIVWMVRDPRASVASLKKVAWASDDAATLARQCARNLRFMLYWERRHGARITRVVYEDLVRAPEDVLRRLHARIGIPFEPRELQPSDDARAVSDWERAWKGNASARISPASIDRWRAALSAAEVAAVERAAGDVMADLGYRPASPGPAPSPWGGLRRAALGQGAVLRGARGLEACRLLAADAWHAYSVGGYSTRK